MINITCNRVPRKAEFHRYTEAYRATGCFMHVHALRKRFVSHDRMQSLQHCTSLHSARACHAASDRNEVVVVVVRRFPLPRQEDFLRRQDGRHFTFSEWFSAQVSDSATYGLDMDCAHLLSLVSAPHARFSLWERLSFLIVSFVDHYR